MPSPTKAGLEAFLAGSFIKGIGKVYAGKIVDFFGLEILNPDFDFGEKLKEIKALPESAIINLEECVATLKVPTATLALLYSAGLNDAEVEKIISHYGKKTERIIGSDPYDLVENVWKFSFFSADKIGRFMGIASDDPRRLRGALLTAVKLYAEDGSMFASEDEAVSTASRISGTDPEKIKPEIENLIEERRLVRSMGGLYLPVYFKAEEEAANKIKELISESDDELMAYKIPEKDIKGNPLTADQKKAIETVLCNKVSIITGGPGTGKTTTVNGIISVLMKMEKKVVLAAPTGRAAKRMSELTGEEAKTIHRLLGYSMGKGYRNKKFKADILVIDEASMLEQVLFNHLLQALDNHTKIVLVGDTDQLPAIGAGNVLKDMIDSGSIPVISLEENFRQNQGSLIATNASNIKAGEGLETSPSNDFIFINEGNVKEIHSRLFSLLKKEIPSYTDIQPKDIQVVTPQQEGPLGAKQLNVEIQEFLNPSAPEIKRGMKRFRLGDRVMQILNSSERGVYNGETGWVSEVDPEGEFLIVTFFDGKKSRYGLKELKELTLAYATTVHKLQGSETDYMVLIMTTSHRPLLYRNLLYTGISRAKKLCIVLGENKAIETAISTADRLQRNSNFKHRLQIP